MRTNVLGASRLMPSFAALATVTALGVGQVIVASPALAAPCVPTITTDGDATVVSFTTVGTCTWTVPTGITNLDAVLIVGGGGGGGLDQGGGGGAGGLVDLTNVSTTPGANLTIVVGAGGAGATNYAPNAGTNGGGNSSFDGVVALGGGYGGSGSINGGSGGSGGGAGYPALGARTGGSALQAGSAAGGLGSAGGASTFDPGGGGGGGAGGAGGASTLSGDVYGGPGGAGVARTITGTSRFYAGGGGGYSRANVAVGGSGIGGNGGRNLSSPTAGAANTGSGGGGGATTFGVGAAGGSGVVIIRYGAPVPTPEAGPVPPSWFQSVGRLTESDACEPGWSPSWAEWMNDRLGGWVCNREIYWDSSIAGWSQR